MRAHHGAPVSAVLIFLYFSIETQATNFTSCKNEISEMKDKKTLPPNDLYQPPPHWFTETEKLKRESLIVLTTEGCKKWCGKGPQFNDSTQVFQVLTTWILPMLALFSNLPYDSPSEKKKRHTLEALFNWIGSPQSAFTTTIFNIYQIQECQKKTRTGDLRQEFADSFFVLSCINQYYYARYETKIDPKDEANKEKYAKKHEEAEILEKRRNLALYYGLFRPLSTTYSTPKEKMQVPGDIEETRFLLYNLANHLRVLRRRGVIPVTLNIIWFFVAFIISLFLAFGKVGDSTTGHSLALGLGLSWLPALVFMTMVDRNPIAPTRCKVLIERWLYNVEAIIQYERDSQNQSIISPSIRWWRPDAEPLELVIDQFVGQGRRLRYCGVTSTVLCRLEAEPALPWHHDDKIERYEKLAVDFEKQVVKRPITWRICWIFGGIFAFIGVSFAFVISFQTGTVGMGCRALLWLVFWLLSSVSWSFQFFAQEPPPMIRWASIVANFVSFLLLLTIMILQTMGGLNTCTCKSSYFAKGWGGYMDFELAGYHKEVYPYILRLWIIAATVGPIGAIGAIIWTMRRWQKSSELWKESTHLVRPLQRPRESEDRQWREGCDPVHWLT